MNKELFVLMEVGWDYNDEVMFRTEGGGGHPTKVFDNEEAANKQCVSKNIEEFKRLTSDGDIRRYFYNLDEILPYADRKNAESKNSHNTASKKLFDLDFDELTDFVNSNDSFPVAVEGASDEDWKAFLDMTTLNFWEVVPVEKG